eukprot:CAMPEP_0119361712 /NCGR_PEP_ID=MMETSP1334-20130426/8967_1 /TAXON_ID=127549 /ORGANISM="Calcidiscus leptoporus, Strain RCC1130" /LENGTH=244 /DNA_ID=CAMNT_0007376797 /DNA_START=160 /DNA_END=894 /DNA_ORIENTATION=+
MTAAAFALLEAASARVVCFYFADADHAARVRSRGCLVSAAHNVWAMAATVALLIRTEHPIGLLSEGPFQFALLAHVPHSTIDAVGAAFAAFLSWDLLYLLRHRRIFAQLLTSTLFHHVVLLGMLWLNKDTLWFNYAFPLMYAGELSTFFLNVRLLYRESGISEMWVSATFAITFFLTRILLLGALVYHLFCNMGAMQTLLSLPLLVSYLILIPTMYVLNLFWGIKILQGVASLLRKKRSLHKAC